MAEAAEVVSLEEVKYLLNKKTIDDVFEKVKISDVQNFDTNLKVEIIYWGQHSVDVSLLTRRYIEQQWESILRNEAGESSDVNNLYYVNENLTGGGEPKYLYDSNVNIVYKIELTGIGPYRVHSVKELEHQQMYGDGDRQVIEQGTVIAGACDIVANGTISYFEPDLSGFIQENTKVIYYNSEGEELEVPVSQYISSEKARTIERENEEYEFYNYEQSKWANIKVEKSGATTYWVWIPRYAYTISENNTNIIFINTSDKNAKTGGDLPSGYIVHPAFDNNLRGIWVSKYEPSSIVTEVGTDYSYYMPDVSGFDDETTYVEVYDEETETFKETRLYDIDDISQFGRQNKWFDYEKQIWANIKTVANGVESWWVWIPRYAYNITGTETSIIFVDIANNPLTGEKLPSNYTVHPAFGNNLKGIWVSKYEVSYTVGESETTNDVNKPDLSGFNQDTTYLEIYNEQTGTFTDKKLSEITDIDAFIQNNNWYDYSKQQWANIKTVVDGVESWWVWIPKYAYNITGTETTVIFLDESGNPRDGSTLPSNYIPHPAFNGVSGIWASKYEVSEK